MKNKRKETGSHLETPSSLKLRLKYVKDTYFDDLGLAELSRRLNGEVANDGDAPTGTPDYLVSKGIERIGIQYRALALQFDPDKSNSPDAAAVQKISLAFARHYLWKKGNRQGAPDAKIVERVTPQLASWIETGSGSPFLCLEGSNFPAIELSFEHLKELETEAASPDSPFAALSPMAGFSSARKYLRGQPAEDWAVLQHVAIERPDEEELLKAIAEDGSRLTVLTSSAGDGRTTILKRAAMRLRKSGWRVFFVHRPRQREDFPRLPKFSADDLPTCVLIDDAERANAYPYLEDDIQSQPGLHVVLSARKHPWQAKEVKFSRTRSISLRRVSEPEIADLAAAIYEFDAASPPASISEIERRLRISVDSDYPHLLAAMLTATQGASFESIIESMIDAFEESGDTWCLKVVAVFSFVDGLSQNRAGRILHNALRATLTSNLQRSSSSSSHSSTMTDIMNRVRSEVLSLPVDRGYVSATEYDLRHPDIVRLVIRRYYDVDGVGQPVAVGIFMDDLAAVLWDEIKGDLATQRTGRNRWRPTTVEFARQLITCREGAHAHFLIRVARHLFDQVLEVLGSFKEERYLATGTLWYWGAEEYKSPDWSDTIDEEGRSISDHIFCRALEINEDAAVPTWANWVIAYQNNCANDPRERSDSIVEYTDRWLYRQAWRAGMFRGPSTPEEFLRYFFSSEISAGNFGDVEKPSQFTARWIARQSWEAGCRHTGLITAWVAFEKQRQNLGESTDPGDFTARWIARQSWGFCKNHSDFVAMFLTLEKDSDNIGNLQGPSEFTARWILRQAWGEGVRSSDIVCSAILLEKSAENVGDFGDPKEFSARWFARQAWGDGLRKSDFIASFVNLEKGEGNTGDLLEPLKFTARWIARHTWDGGVRFADFVCAWIALEKESKNIGDVEEPSRLTARWIARQAWEEGLRAGPFVDAVFKLENDLENFGSLEDPKPFSARWIARKGLAAGLSNAHFLMYWIELEIANNNVGNHPDPEKYSARWIAENCKISIRDDLLARLVQ